MGEQGYPAEDRDQVLAGLLAAQVSILTRNRAAEGLTAGAASGTAPAMDPRLAMTGYRALFRDLLGDPADAQSGPPGGRTRIRLTGPHTTEKRSSNQA